MPHVRKTLTAAVMSEIGSLASVGSNVFEDPAIAIEESTLTAVVVEPAKEEIEILGDVRDVDSGYTQVRLLTLEISVIAKTLASRDTATLEVEEALADSTIGTERHLKRTEFASSGEGAQRIWSAGMTWEFTYLTNSKVPGTEL